MIELKDTIRLMTSDNYKKRFRAEYWQTKIRYEKLHAMCVKYQAGKLDFTPSCPLSLLLEQKAAMGRYLETLEIRAEIEGVDLSEPAGGPTCETCKWRTMIDGKWRCYGPLPEGYYCSHWEKEK